MNLYIASDLDWPEKGVHVRQDTRFPEQQGTTLTITTKNSTSMAINLRIPYWAQGGSAKINGTPLLAFSSPTSYLSLNRVWRSGDKIELNLPMNLHIDPMPDNATVQAMMYGPLVLTGRFEPVTREQQYADYEQKNSTPTEVTDIVADADVATSWAKSDPNQPLTFLRCRPVPASHHGSAISSYPRPLCGVLGGEQEERVMAPAIAGYESLTDFANQVFHQSC